MADETTVRLAGSWPFTSLPSVTYDSRGRQVYDRAVGSGALRRSFAQFFSDGVFGTPADALKISAVDGALAVEVAPGMAIIRGTMAPVCSNTEGLDDGPVTLQLDTSPTRGDKVHGVYLRNDLNDDHRSNYLVVRSATGTAADLPAPTDDAGVKELRIGHVTVPSNSTDLSGATIVMEKGSSVCPYAAPFEDIDVAGVLDHVRRQAQRELDDVARFVDKNIGLIASALDETTAGHLDNRIYNLENPLRLTKTQAMYYYGFSETAPDDWPNGWKTYEQEVADGTAWS